MLRTFWPQLRPPHVLRTGNACDLLVSVSEGLPTLVMAAVRYLAGRNWNLTEAEFESLSAANLPQHTDTTQTTSCRSRCRTRRSESCLSV